MNLYFICYFWLGQTFPGSDQQLSLSFARYKSDSTRGPSRGGSGRGGFGGERTGFGGDRGGRQSFGSDRGGRG